MLKDYGDDYIRSRQQVQAVPREGISTGPQESLLDRVEEKYKNVTLRLVGEGSGKFVGAPSGQTKYVCHRRDRKEWKKKKKLEWRDTRKSSEKHFTATRLCETMSTAHTSATCLHGSSSI